MSRLGDIWGGEQGFPHAWRLTGRGRELAH